MADELFTILGQVGAIAILGGIGAALYRRHFQLRWFIVALLLYVIYDVLLTRGLFLIPSLPADSDWNWLGKVMSLAGMLIVASLPHFGFKKIGLALPQRANVTTPIVVLLVLLGLFAYLAVSDDSGVADLETIVFQWTMPSFDEEIFYRGVLLLAMNEAFARRATILGAPIGYGGLLTSVLFGLAHSLSFANGGFEFDLFSFLITGVPSLILLWLRERTGSLLLPIIGHCASNGLFTIL